jgi:hypothetical protein
MMPLVVLASNEDVTRSHLSRFLVGYYCFGGYL